MIVPWLILRILVHWSWIIDHALIDLMNNCGLMILTMDCTLVIDLQRLIIPCKFWRDWSWTINHTYIDWSCELWVNDLERWIAPWWLILWIPVDWSWVCLALSFLYPDWPCYRSPTWALSLFCSRWLCDKRCRCNPVSISLPAVRHRFPWSRLC